MPNRACNRSAAPKQTGQPPLSERRRQSDTLSELPLGSLGLAHAGATVFATGRTIAPADLESGIRAIVCDHTDMAHELRSHGVTVVSPYTGLVRTEAVLAAGVFDLSNLESPEFIGRAVAALAGDLNISRWSGRVVEAAVLGAEYGFSDVDGRRPRPLTLTDG